MGDSIESPWKEGTDLDIEEFGDSDFERRSDYISLQDSTGTVPAIAEVLASEWGLTKNKAADRCVRMYIAHLLDTHNLDLREEYEVVTLIPPKGWVEQIEPLNVEYESGEKENLNISVPPTVRDMVDELVERDDTEVTSTADFLRQSVLWMVEE